MKKIVSWLAPKDKKFFIMLNEQAENALEAAKQLKEFIDNYDKIERKGRQSVAQSIKSIEARGDALTSAILEKIDRNFKTPFEGGDVKQIAILLDDILDLTSRAASRFFILSVERINDHILRLAEISVKLVNELKEMISDLKELRIVKEHYLEIYRLEKDADNLFNESLSELFHFYKNPVDIMKYREIYEILESLADKCKDVANAVESLSIKHK